ncbi:General secretion pathway protein G [Candidatus Magnetoovum chiemensis]|nr:General secretion pathway protein G [Candidatus Magnetoovum chiemensis]
MKNKGFTLIEILIVVMIIALIASIVGPNLLKRGDEAKIKIAQAQVEMLYSSTQSFYLDLSRCPKDMQELLKSDEKKWKGPYLSKEEVPKDPWDREYQYKCPGDNGRTFDIYSLGPNGKMDDNIIKSW